MTNSSTLYQTRLKKLRQFLSSNQAVLISAPADILYFTGFKQLVPQERESFLIITPKDTLFFHASFSPFKSTQGIEALIGCSLTQITTALEKLNQQQKIKKLLVDKTNLCVNEYEQLVKELPSFKIDGFDRQHIWKLRTIKDQTEVKRLTTAGEITSQVMEKALHSLKAGMTEIELQNIIETKLKRLGSPHPSFPTIVAFGKNSALPHHQPTSTKLKSEMVVLIDLGATYAGYHGDMTRTIWFGESPSSEFLKIKKIVKDAYRVALATVRPDKKQILAQDIDRVARNLITQAGYGKNFIHTTGHGLGLDIHENLSLFFKNNQPILPQMVITIEPGIYLPNKFGYRYENMILVTKQKALELTHD